MGSASFVSTSYATLEPAILGTDVAFVKMTIILHKYREVCNIVDGLIDVLIDQI